MVEISKELLSEVLNETRVILDYEVSIDNTEIHWGHKDIDEDGFISIYELAFKCKEWVINKGYVLRICYVLENDTRELCFVETTLLKSDQYLSDYYDMDSNTEVEAIIKASEWILKELNK